MSGQQSGFTVWIAEELGLSAARSAYLFAISPASLHTFIHLGGRLEVSPKYPRLFPIPPAIAFLFP